jgi:hypothetical protein
MTSATCDPIIKTLRAQLSDRFEAVPFGRSCVVVTPFLYPDNTPISVEIAPQEDGSVLVSDNGEAADYAFIHGVGSRIVSQRLSFVRERFQVSVKDGEIAKAAPSNAVGNAVLSVLGGIQDVGYLVYKGTNVRSAQQFKYEVEGFLASSHRVYKKDVVIQGRTGNRTFDYVVQGDNKQLLLAPFEANSAKGAETKAKVLYFNYNDVRQAVQTSELPLDFAVLIDTRGVRASQAITSEVRSILDTYIPHVISWEDRHHLEEILAAA